LKEDHMFFNSYVGGFCCYHCGDSFKCLPASLPMLGVIGKQFKKEHKKCRKTAAGEALEAENIAKHQAENQSSVGILGPKPGCSMGEKIAFQLEMETLSKSLDGDIPKELAKDSEYVKAIKNLKESGFTLEKVKTT